MDTKSFLEAQNLLFKMSRDFFVQKNFTEIHTPILVGCGGAEIHLDFFETTWIDSQNKSHLLDLRTSPEIYLKTLIAKHGLNKVFEIGTCFRNVGEHSRWHRPEFKMLEWYETETNLDQMMSTTEEYLRFTVSCFSEQKVLNQKWSESDFNDIPRWSIEKCFTDFLGIELKSSWQQKPDDFYKALCSKTKNPSIREEDDFETLFFKIMLDEIEPRLKEFPAIFIFNYPASTSALAKISSDGWAQRFEAYVQGIELCNAFDEILDPSEGMKRCSEIFAEREKHKSSTEHKIQTQERFLNNMNQAFNASRFRSMTGNALGLDRWLLLLLGMNFDQRDYIF